MPRIWSPRGLRTPQPTTLNLPERQEAHPGTPPGGTGYLWFTGSGSQAGLRAKDDAGTLYFPNTGDGVSYTPTGAFNTNCTYTGRYWRMGNLIWNSVRLAFTGAPNSTTCTLNGPSGLTIDTASMPGSGHATRGSILGTAWMYDASAATPDIGPLVVFWRNDLATIQPLRITTATSSSNTPHMTGITQAAPVTLANGDFIDFLYWLPISDLAA